MFTNKVCDGNKLSRKFLGIIQGKKTFAFFVLRKTSLFTSCYCVSSLYISHRHYLKRNVCKISNKCIISWDQQWSTNDIENLIMFMLWHLWKALETDKVPWSRSKPCFTGFSNLNISSFIPHSSHSTWHAPRCWNQFLELIIYCS